VKYYSILVTQSVSSWPYRMLSERRLELERRGFIRQERRLLPVAFGLFIAGLAAWDWFVNPITFRDRSHYVGAPSQESAMREIVKWLADIETEAGRPIGWVIAEEFGRVGGRFHCHGLVAGVAHLRRKFWWHEAYRRFGRTKIEPFDAERGAAFYAAKYAAKALGEIHFGGVLGDAGESRIPDSEFWLRRDGELVERKVGVEIVRSAPVAKEFYHSGVSRWHR